MVSKVQDIHIFHADSLAGPMRECKIAFERENEFVRVHLLSGRSKELAERINAGNTCDVAVFSDPGVIREDLIEHGVASWYIVFSANQMVMITGKERDVPICELTDLDREQLRLVRVTGEKDLATYRTLECLRRASMVYDQADLNERILHRTAVWAGTIPEAIQAVKEGKADAGIVYLSAALAHQDSVQVTLLPDTINLSDQIRNAMTIPATAQNKPIAKKFAQFLLSDHGQQILQRTGQPPQIPPIIEGKLPADLLVRF